MGQEMNLKNQKKRKRTVLPEKQRREDILQAALEIFAKRGYHQSRMSDIAAVAGVAHGTVYRYFPNKRTLAMELIGITGATGFMESIGDDSLVKLSPRDFMYSIGKKYFGKLEQRIPIIRFVVSESAFNKEFGKEYYRKVRHRLMENIAVYFKAFQDKNLIRKGDPYIYAHIFHNMLYGFLYSQEILQGKDIVPLATDKIINEVVDIFLHGVAIKDIPRGKTPR
ncbi:MAG: TetR/AcrR family transcriptional regulator [Syntrophales bacterium]|jgi:AcrR family transcriptional regulator